MIDSWPTITLAISSRTRSRASRSRATIAASSFEGAAGSARPGRVGSRLFHAMIAFLRDSGVAIRLRAGTGREKGPGRVVGLA